MDEGLSSLMLGKLESLLEQLGNHRTTDVDISKDKKLNIYEGSTRAIQRLLKAGN